MQPHLFFCGFSYDIMHSCWSPVPKCRPSFQHLVSQLEALWLGLSPASPPKEPLLYVNLEGEERESRREGGGGARAPEEEDAAECWSVPWQQRGEDEVWPAPGPGAGLALGGDYRYILSPRGGADEEEEEGGRIREQEDVKDEDDDVIINV